MNQTLTALDWSIVILYIVILVGLAFYSKLRKHQNTEEYLVAKHSMNWFIVAIAVFATLFSTISFVSIPGEAYNHGLILLGTSVAQLLVVPLAIWLFLRFFFNAPTFTAYEYLERRYDRKCRVMASLIFLMIRLFYTGCVFYSAAILFETMLGWNPAVTILTIGIITVFYAWLGGSRAVILADVIQSAIILCGIVAILFRILQVIGFDFGAVIHFAHVHNHLFEEATTSEFYRINVHDRWNFYLLILVVLNGPLVAMSCDQMVIQRLLAGKNYKQAVRSTYTNYFLSIPMVLMLYGIGLCLFYYYNGGGGILPEQTSGDQVLGHFITTMLPAPLPGLIATALLSALMSTVAGAVNSLVTVLLKDIVVLAIPGIEGTAKEMTWCRVLTIVTGMIAVGLALMLYFMGKGIRTTVLEVTGVWASLWPILLSAFLYGVLSRRVSAKAMFISLIAGTLAGLLVPYVFYYLMPPAYRWGFQWVGLPGQLLSLTLPPLLSLIWPNHKKLDNLTVFTTEKFIKENS